ncbi:hypothetical protein [Moorena producens]
MSAFAIPSVDFSDPVQEFTQSVTKLYIDWVGYDNHQPETLC